MSVPQDMVTSIKSIKKQQRTERSQRINKQRESENKQIIIQNTKIKTNGAELKGNI